MKWREIEDLFLSGAGRGGSPDARAAQKRFTFLSEAQRKIASSVKLPDFFGRVSINTTANQDWIPAPEDCYAIDWIQNREGGHKLRQEPEGSKGRAKFFDEDTDAPVTGNIDSVNFYWHEGGKIWLRDTPNEIGLLDINYFKHPVVVTEEMLDAEPVIPTQYHFAIAEVAIGLYYTVHPPLDPTSQIPMVNFGKSRVQAALAEIGGQQLHPRTEENLDRQKGLRQPGYTMGGCR